MACLPNFKFIGAVLQFQECKERSCVLVETGLAGLERTNSEGRENIERILVRIEMRCDLAAQLTVPAGYKERDSSTQCTITSQTNVITLLKHLFHFIIDNIIILFYSFLPHVFVKMIRLCIILHILLICQ